jgi:hypothetical protein
LERAADAGRTAPRVANLAAALLERCDLDGKPEDHHRAVTLLREALEDTEATPTARATRMIMLLGAHLDAVERGFGGVSLDDLIDFGEQVIGEFPGAQRGEPENLLGSAYMIAAQRGHPRTDLQRMVALLDAAVAKLPAGHPDLPARLSNLGGALLDRYEITGARDNLVRAAAVTEQAYLGFPDGHPSRPLALNNHVNATVAAYERFGEAGRLSEMLPKGRDLTKAFLPEHPLYPVALSNVGLLFRAASRALNRPDLIDEAIRCHETAVQATAAGNPARAGRLASLALALADRYDRDQQADDLDQAVALGPRAWTAQPATTWS